MPGIRFTNQFIHNDSWIFGAYVIARLYADDQFYIWSIQPRSRISCRFHEGSSKEIVAVGFAWTWQDPRQILADYERREINNA